MKHSLPPRTIITLTVTIGLALNLLLPTNAHSQIYKYQDEDGRWHYTDKKPPDHKNAEVVGQEKSTGNSSGRVPTVDLKKQLEDRYPASQPELKASLAVVTVRTGVSTGSGFFISDNGYLITNKHVVRPKVSTGWKQQQQELEIEEQNLKRRLAYLKEEKSRIASNEQTLRQMKDSINNPDSYRNPVTQQEYDAHKANHKQRQRDYRKNLSEARQHERQLEKHRREFAISSSAASVAKRFTLITKDGTRLKAQLVKVSKNHDLALLKVNGYTTPHLKPADYKWPQQSQPVFAIGSPLSQSDSITAGKVTGVKQDRILVDATILPGSSGGPLVDDSGDLLGVNTQRIIDNRFNGANGFGVAIPKVVVMEEFGQFIGS